LVCFRGRSDSSERLFYFRAKEHLAAPASSLT
jgi:hypothetical protein